mgnify:CR=1 FL=1
MQITAYSPAELAASIDHTLLKPEAQRDDIARVCDEALEHGFAAVCVNSYWVPMVAARLRDSGVTTCSVVGFPLGASSPAVKAFETRAAVEAGAAEIDMVIDVGSLRTGDLDRVEALGGRSFAGARAPR